MFRDPFASETTEVEKLTALKKQASEFLSRLPDNHGPPIKSRNFMIEFLNCLLKCQSSQYCKKYCRYLLQSAHCELRRNGRHTLDEFLFIKKRFESIYPDLDSIFYAY